MHIALNFSYSLAQSEQILTNLSIGCSSGHSFLIRLLYRQGTEIFLKFFYIVPSSTKLAP